MEESKTDCANPEYYEKKRIEALREAMRKEESTRIEALKKEMEKRIEELYGEKK